MKYAILIPAYNAADTLPELLDRIGRYPVKPEKIVIIDDGSEDGTAGAVNGNPAALVRSFNTNRGKGAALKAGFEIILGDVDTDYILCMDADLQHPVESIGKFVEKAENENAGFIIGNRVKKPGLMPLHRILSNKITSWFISRLTGQHIKDSQCGYRMLRRDVLDQLHLRETGFQFESEMIIQAARSGYKIDFIDIPTIYQSDRSHIRNVIDTFKFIRLVIRESFGR
jgi:glycosyltransferase involved in cell wall biosynthesis